MTAAQRDYEGHPSELAIILSGRKDPLHALLAASPALAARFPAIIDFPGYTPPSSPPSSPNWPAKPGSA